MSGEIGIIVQARMSSSRFPGKSLQMIGDKPLLFFVLQRLKLTNLPLIVCTSNHPSDDGLCDYLETEGYEYFRGSLENVLNRYIETAHAFNIKKIIRITGDNPLVDTDYLMDSLPLFQKFDFIDGIYPKGLIKGTGFEMVDLEELEKIPASQEEHQEHVTSWLRKNIASSEKRIQLKPNRYNRHRDDIFLTCDYPQDLILLWKIFEHFNYRHDIPVKEVVAFLDGNPLIKEINKNYH